MAKSCDAQRRVFVKKLLLLPQLLKTGCLDIFFLGVGR